MLAKHAQKLVFLKYGKFCGICGNRYNNAPIWKLNMRVCEQCMKERFISNTQLFLQYGIEYFKLFKENEKRFQDIFFFEVENGSYLGSRQLLQKYCYSHIQRVNFAKEHIEVPVPTVFFWLPDLERNFPLLEMQKENKEREKNAQVLCGYIRAFYVKMLICHRENPFTVVQRLRRDFQKKQGGYPTQLEIAEIIRKIIVGILVDDKGIYHALKKQFFERFRHRRSIMCDHNPKKIILLLRNHESARTFSVRKWTVPGVRNTPYYEMQRRISTLAAL
jgi:hypothetical protein